MKGNFAIVQFLNKNAVEAVPCRWLEKAKVSKSIAFKSISQCLVIISKSLWQWMIAWNGIIKIYSIERPNS